MIEKDALSSLRKLTEVYRSILIVADENTFAAAGDKTLSAIADKHSRTVIFPGSPILIPNEDAIARITQELSGIDLIIGIGSGVIQDLC